MRLTAILGVGWFAFLVLAAYSGWHHLGLSAASLSAASGLAAIASVFKW